MRPRHLVGLLLFAPLPALAQDLETRETELDEDAPFQVGVDFESEWHEISNLDFRPLDESSDQAILDSDDRFSFAFTSLAVDLRVNPDDRLSFTLGASHRGLWGNDQIGNTNAFGGWVYFNALKVDYALSEANPRTRLTIGREFVDIGGLGGAPDNALGDVVDHVQLDLGVGDVATFSLVPVDVMGLLASEDDNTLIALAATGQTSPFPMRGDRMTRRHGVLFSLDGLDLPLIATAYAFYTDIGSAGTGSDISYEGLLGNFTDNDWVANYGLRAQVSAGPITPFAGVDLSSGVDRKELVANDVDTNGSAITAGATLDTGAEQPTRLQATASFYRSLGAAYGEDGLMYSHGYVSMKGVHTGGHIVSRLLGWHPNSYVGRLGVTTMEHEPARSGGTQVLHAGAELSTGSGLGLGLSWWHMSDTGVTFVDLANIELIEPPYGYSRDEFAAQERLGQALGQEINLELSYALSERFALYGTGAALLPGPYYAVLVQRVAGDQLGGEATALAGMLGAEASF